jgi:hypothetical protein
MGGEEVNQMTLMRVHAVAVVAVALLVGASVGVTAQDETLAAAADAPVAFTGHIECGPEVRTGIEEPGAEIGAVNMSRGYAWQPVATEMSDPRLMGRYYISYDSNDYGTAAVGGIGSGTWRIVNDAGAWQGSYPAVVDFPDSTSSTVTVPLTGEGDYEGLIAIWEQEFNPLICSWEVRGVIIEGEVPTVPEAFDPDA